MAKGKQITKSIYLPEKIVEKIDLNKEETDSFSSSLIKILKLGLETKFQAEKNQNYFSTLSSIENEIKNLKHFVISNDNEEFIDSKLSYLSQELLFKINEELETKISILSADIEKLIEDKFEKFREGLNKLSKLIISIDESLKNQKKIID